MTAYVQTAESRLPGAAPHAFEAETVALLQRICVRPPYFALRGLRSPEAGTCAAWVAPEQPLGAEVGPIAAAEAGRHLASLGSAAAASLNDDGEQRYYLARSAHIERVGPGGVERVPALVAEARARLDGSRGAIAHAALRTPAGVVTHRLSVEYMIMSARVFERTFRARRRPTEQAAHNPHADPQLMAVYTLDDARAGATLRFSAEQCAGHFDGCPAVPVARLMQGLVSLAGSLFQHRAGDPRARFGVMRADVRAQRLAFAGDELVLHAEHACDRGGETGVRCRATLKDGAVVGEMDLWLAALGT